MPSINSVLVTVAALLTLLSNVGVAAAPKRGHSPRPSWDNCYGRHCQVGEYCGTNEPFQSCRPCTHIAGWCNDTRYVEENFFPCLQTCKSLLLEQHLAELQNKTLELEAKVTEIRSDNTLLIIIAGIAGTFAVAAVVISCLIRRHRCTCHDQLSQTATAATAGKSMRSLFGKLLRSMGRWRRGKRPVICLNPHAPSYSLANTGVHEVSPDDGGSERLMSDVVVPGGDGTAHQPEDSRDFRESSALSPAAEQMMEGTDLRSTELFKV